jgi:lysyl-tRNA synthetase class 1
VGGKKMSSSKGNAATAAEMVEILPPHILRLLLLKSPISRQLDFDPDGDAIPVLFDTYDRLAERYWAGEEGDDRQIFTFIHLPENRSPITRRFLPRFSQIAFFVQMPHIDLLTEVAELKGGALTDDDKAEVILRAHYARHWLTEYADDKFIFTLQKTLPVVSESLTAEQLGAVDALATKIEQHDTTDGQALHELIHEVKEASGLSPKDFFGAIYLLFLGKESGPKVGWFLSTLEKDFVVKRLRREA